MKYKIGDKVKVKTQEQMEEAMDLLPGSGFYPGSGLRGYPIPSIMKEDLDLHFPDRILTIEETHDDEITYSVEETHWKFSDDMIECLAENYIDPSWEPVLNRFEIMDL